jgi:outer membrane protein TolC
MLDFMQSIYQIGGNNQSDLIGAELELIKLDEKVLDAERNYQTFRSELNTLANTVFTEEYLNSELITLPVLTIPANENLFASLAQHPDLLILKETSDQLADKIALVEQDKKAQWGIEVSYGLRQGENPNGSNRSDLLSAGLSVQVPLFSGKQKTHGVSSVRYQQDAIENKYLEKLQKTRFELENLKQQYENTLAQRMLFETQILPTLAKQKQSALQSYESDKGDFRTVTDLYIKEQATKVKHQRLRVNEQLILSKINYWLNSDSAISEKYVRREFDQETF